MLKEQTGPLGSTSLPEEGSSISAKELYLEAITFASQIQEFFCLPGEDGSHRCAVILLVVVVCKKHYPLNLLSNYLPD